jgi:hypothetical protein
MRFGKFMGLDELYRWVRMPMEEIAGVVFVVRSARVLREWDTACDRHGLGPLRRARRAL